MSAPRYGPADGMRRCQPCEVHDEHERCLRRTTLGTDQRGLGDVCGCSCPQATEGRAHAKSWIAKNGGR